MNEINCIKKDQSLIHVTKNFLDFGIVPLNFAGVRRGSREKTFSDSHFACFGEITHFKGLNSCIVFFVECNNINFCNAVW